MAFRLSGDKVKDRDMDWGSDRIGIEIGIGLRLELRSN